MKQKRSTSKRPAKKRGLGAQIVALEKDLKAAITPGRREAIGGELSYLKAVQDRERREGTVPLPTSYIEERKANRDLAARVSGRKRISARFLQGGAPGSGRGGKK